MLGQSTWTAPLAAPASCSIGTPTCLLVRGQIPGRRCQQAPGRKGSAAPPAIRARATLLPAALKRRHGSADLGGLGPGEPEGPVSTPALATVVWRCGGLSRSWGARLACLTRRGRPSISPSPSGSAAPGPGAGPPGPLSRLSSQGGPAAWPGCGEATLVIGGRPGWSARARRGPAAGCRRVATVQPGIGPGWSGYSGACARIRRGTAAGERRRPARER